MTTVDKTGASDAEFQARIAPFDAVTTDVVILNERTRSGGESGAGVMRNRCAFTPRDMGADWPEAFTYAVVLGWDDAMEQMAARWEWDPALVEFLRDAHRRFQDLADRQSVDGEPDLATDLAERGLRACCGQPSERHCR